MELRACQRIKGEKFRGQEGMDQDVRDCKVRVVVIDSKTDFNGLTQVRLSFTENNKTLKT